MFLVMQTRKISMRLRRVMRRTCGTEFRCEDHRGRVIRDIALRPLRRRLHRPRLVIAFRRLRQPPVGGWLDLEASVTRPLAGARIIVTDLRSEIDNAAAID